MSPFPGLSSHDGFGRIAGVCGPYRNEQANPIRKVIITPHTGGETRLYEEPVIDILEENLNGLWSGQMDLRNQIL